MFGSSPAARPPPRTTGARRGLARGLTNGRDPLRHWPRDGAAGEVGALRTRGGLACCRSVDGEGAKSATQAAASTLPAQWRRVRESLPPLRHDPLGGRFGRPSDRRRRPTSSATTPWRRLSPRPDHRRALPDAGETETWGRCRSRSGLRERAQFAPLLRFTRGRRPRHPLRLSSPQAAFSCRQTACLPSR